MLWTVRSNTERNSSGSLIGSRRGACGTALLRGSRQWTTRSLMCLALELGGLIFLSACVNSLMAPSRTQSNNERSPSDIARLCSCSPVPWHRGQSTDFDEVSNCFCHSTFLLLPASPRTAGTKPSQRSHERTSSGLAFGFLRKLPCPGRDQYPCSRMVRSSGFSWEKGRLWAHSPSEVIRLKNGNKMFLRTPLRTPSASVLRKISSSGSAAGWATKSFSSTV